MSPDEQKKPTDNNTEPLVTGEEVELSSEHFLEDVTAMGEVEPAPYLPEEEAVVAASETATDEAFLAAEAAAVASPPERGDVDDSAPRDVLGNRGDAYFSEVDETMVTEETPVSPTDTGVLRRSLVESTQPLPRRDEIPAVIVESPAVPTAETLFAGATVLPTLPSRAGARWLSAFAFLFLVPLAWYLLADAGARFVAAVDNPWSTGTVNPAAVAEFLGGIAVIIILGIVAAQSSLGLTIVGVILIIIGLPFVVVPGYTSTFIDDILAGPLKGLGVVGENALFHLTFTGATGILCAAGVTMVTASWVVSRVRRKGRAEEALRQEVAHANPEGLKARWARKASGQ